MEEFLAQYWQKKTLLIRNALPHFKNPLTAEELAGLSMEDELESRLVRQYSGKAVEWSLKRGPFLQKDFKALPKSHWTLLVQGVDRFIPEVTSLLDHFNFIPQWRIDDVMISYAVEQGSVGPHYDNYDVFLYQAQGRRKWLLTSQNCVESNYVPDLELRIMQQFDIEEEYILEQGDMLYLPPKIGHHGISLDNECFTFSFGYRGYTDLELWDSFSDYLFSIDKIPAFYKDPPWTALKETSELPQESWLQAKALMKTLLNDDALIKDWFGRFATSLDQQAEALLPLEDDACEDIMQFKRNLMSSSGLIRNPLCRFAYIELLEMGKLSFYMNGAPYSIDKVSEALIKKVANNRHLLLEELLPFINNSADLSFLHNLWSEHMLELIEPN